MLFWVCFLLWSLESLQQNEGIDIFFCCLFALCNSCWYLQLVFFGFIDLWSTDTCYVLLERVVLLLMASLVSALLKLKWVCDIFIVLVRNLKKNSCFNLLGTLFAYIFWTFNIMVEICSFDTFWFSCFRFCLLFRFKFVTLSCELWEWKGKGLYKVFTVIDKKQNSYFRFLQKAKGKKEEWFI